MSQPGFPTNCKHCKATLRSSIAAASHYKRFPDHLSEGHRKTLATKKRFRLKHRAGAASILAHTLDGATIPVVCDPEDVERLNRYRWVVRQDGYAHSNIDGVSVTIGRFVLGKTKAPGRVKLKGGKLDARKNSLRYASTSTADTKPGWGTWKKSKSKKSNGAARGEVKIVQEDRPFWVVYRSNGKRDIEVFSHQDRQKAIEFLLDEETR